MAPFRHQPPSKATIFPEEPFWSSERLKREMPLGRLLDPYDERRVKHGAYEMSLGSEIFVTADPNGKQQHEKLIVSDTAQAVIPPGQFALLLTEEVVTIPTNAIGFISIKAGVKFRGLINVSGFHVDPGFTGRLKFSVYNAGAQYVNLSRNKPLFLIWFADLDAPTEDLYRGEHENQCEITSRDVMDIQGEVPSPIQLKRDIDVLRNSVKVLQWSLGVLASFAIGVVLMLLRTLPHSDASSTSCGFQIGPTVRHDKTSPATVTSPSPISVSSPTARPERPQP